MRPRENHELSKVGAGGLQGTAIESNKRLISHLKTIKSFFTFLPLPMAKRNFFGKLCSRIWTLVLSSSMLHSNHEAASTIHLDGAVSWDRNILAIKSEKQK